jgi:RNA polymerase sigma-70 factor (ECF subfamily)
MLANDVRLTADGGGKVTTVAEVLEGASVMAFITRRLRGWWAAYDWDFVDINGARGLVLRQGDSIVATVSFAFDAENRVSDIFIVRNPDKLTGLNDINVH